jgi:hypothetical protein
MLLKWVKDIHHWLAAEKPRKQSYSNKPLHGPLALQTLEDRLVLSNWFTQNMPDTALANLAQTDFTRDGAITYSDMLGILQTAEGQGKVTSAEFSSLKALAGDASGLKIPSYVDYLATQVIDGNPSNKYYQYLNSSGAEVTQNLGNLAVNSSAATLTDLVNKWFLGYNEPVSLTSYSAVSGTLFGANGPEYTDVNQGYAGDCWMLASLAEAADRDPSLITNMFTSDGTEVVNGQTVGVWTVEFYDNGKPVYVTVNGELPSGGGLYDHPADGGVLWVALAEKAYAEANGAGMVTTNYDGYNNYAALNYGWPSWALSAITGQSSNNYTLNTTTAVSKFEAGDLVVLCTGQTTKSQYIVPEHCYALISYTASSSTPFLIYNPWGTDSAGWALGTYNGHDVYGLFYATSTFVAQNFDYDSYGVSAATGTSTFAYESSTFTTPSEDTQSAGSSGSAITAPVESSTDSLVIQGIQDLMNFDNLPGADFGQDQLVANLAVATA